MKAAVVHDFTQPLSIEDVPTPEAGDGQVLVRIEACGLCHTDIHAAHGDWPIKPPLPLIPGHEGVGIVEALGPGTGEEIQVMVRELPLSGALFVTTPQDLAQMDAERTLAHLHEHAVPIIGMVQNMASLTCPHCAQAIDLYSLSKRL